MVLAGNEAFSRVAMIDALLKNVGWELADGRGVRFEYALANGTHADYVLCDRHGHSMAAIEAKRPSTNPADDDTKGDLFEHVLTQIKQAGELGQFRKPRRIIRAIVELVDRKIGETVYDSATGTAGFLVAAYNPSGLATPPRTARSKWKSTASASGCQRSPS